MAWNRQNTDLTTTKEILIGTTRGKIFETVIEANEKAFMERLVGGKDQTFKPVSSNSNCSSRSIIIIIAILYIVYIYITIFLIHYGYIYLFLFRYTIWERVCR